MLPRGIPARGPPCEIPRPLPLIAAFEAALEEKRRCPLLRLRSAALNGAMGEPRGDETASAHATTGDKSYLERAGETRNNSPGFARNSAKDAEKPCGAPRYGPPHIARFTISAIQSRSIETLAHETSGVLCARARALGLSLRTNFVLVDFSAEIENDERARARALWVCEHADILAHAQLQRRQREREEGREAQKDA